MMKTMVTAAAAAVSHPGEGDRRADPYDRGDTVGYDEVEDVIFGPLVEPCHDEQKEGFDSCDKVFHSKIIFW